MHITRIGYKSFLNKCKNKLDKTRIVVKSAHTIITIFNTFDFDM